MKRRKKGRSFEIKSIVKLGEEGICTLLLLGEDSLHAFTGFAADFRSLKARRTSQISSLDTSGISTILGAVSQDIYGFHDLQEVARDYACP